MNYHPPESDDGDEEGREMEYDSDSSASDSELEAKMNQVGRLSLICSNTRTRGHVCVSIIASKFYKIT
jgi:hypothetical protein